MIAGEKSNKSLKQKIPPPPPPPVVKTFKKKLKARNKKQVYELKKLSRK